MTPTNPNSISPASALQTLQSGNRNFAMGFMRRSGTGPVSMAMNAGGQRPFAVVLTCSDSRMSPELLFDCGVGDIFVLRTGGNVVDALVVGSIEYAVSVLNSPLVVIMGHTRCGAVQAAIAGEDLGGSIGLVVGKVKRAVDTVRERLPNVGGEQLEYEVASENVRSGIGDLLADSRMLRDGVESGRLRIVGAMCDITNGAVRWLDAEEPAPAGLTDATDMCK